MLLFDELLIANFAIFLSKYCNFSHYAHHSTQETLVVLLAHLVDLSLHHYYDIKRKYKVNSVLNLQFSDQWPFRLVTLPQMLMAAVDVEYLYLCLHFVDVRLLKLSC